VTTSRDRSMTHSLDLTLTATTGNDYIPYLRKYLIAAHKLLGKRTALREMSVALIGDRTMSRLHQQFMGIPGPTDVLTFPLEMARGSPKNRALSGEVVIDVAEARRRGKSEGIAPKLEVLLYAIHGMLHLCGYDDQTDRAYRAMHRMEDHLLTKLGLGPVFHRTTHATGSRADSRGGNTGAIPNSQRRTIPHAPRGSRRR